ncbi:probable protein ABIL5 isoform X2 [Phragmites australis]|uniref:probable protein ABIL5 isoform X2 n=1 Tax=Phragmites australis TaxID=29695 RepID=UPI002D79FE6B|nr:probable protein ABIL5 isoform X2 [Phragmites australis]
MDAEAGKARVQQQGAASSASTSSSVVPFDRSSPRLGAPGAESFHGALKELKDLRFQLQEAADCCEKAFLNTEKKKLILEGTKSYVCGAIVAVIDHLGTVSSKLEHKLQEKTDITPTERKINFLKQRLLTCEHYAISLKLLTARGDPDAIKYHRRYIAQCIQRSKEENCATSSKDDPKLPEIFRPSPIVSGATLIKPYDVQLQSAIGKEHTMATANVDESPRVIRRSSSFRAENVHAVLVDHKKKANHGSNILSFLKKTWRHA